MTNDVKGVQDLDDALIDLVSGGDKTQDRIRQAGRDAANWLEDRWDDAKELWDRFF